MTFFHCASMKAHIEIVVLGFSVACLGFVEVLEVKNGRGLSYHSSVLL